MADGQTKIVREGLVSFTFWMKPSLRLAIKKLALDLNRPVQDLMDEAARDLLAKHCQKGTR